MRVVHWAKNHMKCEVDETRLGLKIIPIRKDIRAWTCHPNDKGMYDLMRYLAKVGGVSKRDIEIAVKGDLQLPKNK